MKEKDMIFVFTGPAGSGRKTVADMVGNTLGIPKVLSYTTRKRRPAEMDGQDHHFVSRAAFLEAVEKGEFLEHVEVDGEMFGVKERDIAEMFERHEFVFAIMNAQGARTLKEKYGERVTRIFVYADPATIIDRMVKEGLDKETIDRHIAHYQEEMAYQKECKHSVENNDLAHTVFAVTNLLEQYMDRQLVDKD